MKKIFTLTFIACLLSSCLLAVQNPEQTQKDSIRPVVTGSGLYIVEGTITKNLENSKVEIVYLTAKSSKSKKELHNSIKKTSKQQVVKVKNSKSEKKSVPILPKERINSKPNPYSFSSFDNGRIAAVVPIFYLKYPPNYLNINELIKIFHNNLKVKNYDYFFNISSLYFIDVHTVRPPPSFFS